MGQSPTTRWPGSTGKGLGATSTRSFPERRLASRGSAIEGAATQVVIGGAGPRRAPSAASSVDCTNAFSSSISGSAIRRPIASIPVTASGTSGTWRPKNPSVGFAHDEGLGATNSGSLLPPGVGATGYPGPVRRATFRSSCRRLAVQISADRDERQQEGDGVAARSGERCAYRHRLQRRPPHDEVAREGVPEDVPADPAQAKAPPRPT